MYIIPRPVSTRSHVHYFQTCIYKVACPLFPDMYPQDRMSIISRPVSTRSYVLYFQICIYKVAMDVDTGLDKGLKDNEYNVAQLGIF